MQIHIEDKRLRPILEKVQADVRLDSEDGVALFELGYSGRRLHGESGSRAQTRQRNVVQREPPHQSHRCLRGELQAVRFRQARQGSQGVYLVAR